MPSEYRVRIVTTKITFFKKMKASCKKNLSTLWIINQIMFALRSKEDQKGNKETRKAFFPNLTNYINQSLLLTAWYDWLSKEVFARRGFYGANLYYAFISHINIFLQDVITALEISDSEAQSFFQIKFHPLF